MTTTLSLKKLNVILVAFCMITLLASCARSLQGDVYSREEAQRAMNFEWGTVEATRPVVIEGDRSEKGTLAGAVIGGIAGNTATAGRGQGLATAVGAVAGAIAGQATEEKMTRAQGLEITLRLDSGDHKVIVQEVKDVNEFVAGDRVKVITGAGKLRVAK